MTEEPSKNVLLECLHEWHLECRNDAKWIHKCLTVVDYLQQTRIITQLEADGLRFQIEQCPGHHDEGGRSWCAYCGDALNGQINEI